MKAASFLSNGVTFYGLVTAFFAIAALLSTLGTAFGERQRRLQLTALARDERHVLYERTLAVLRTACTGEQKSGLAQYCREQAHLLSRMQECGTACRAECRRHLPVATR